MARNTIFCNHYRAMAEHDTCEVGVAYDTILTRRLQRPHPCRVQDRRLR